MTMLERELKKILTLLQKLKSKQFANVIRNYKLKLDDKKTKKNKK